MNSGQIVGNHLRLRDNHARGHRSLFPLPERNCWAILRWPKTLLRGMKSITIFLLKWKLLLANMNNKKMHRGRKVVMSRNDGGYTNFHLKNRINKVLLLAERSRLLQTYLCNSRNAELAIYVLEVPLVYLTQINKFRDAQVCSFFRSAYFYRNEFVEHAYILVRYFRCTKQLL